MLLQKGLVYLYSKKFLALLLHFCNYNLSPNGQIISLIGAQAHPKHNPWGLNGTKYWRFFIVEYLQPNKFKEKPNFNPIYQVSCFSSLGDASCFHVFPGKGRLSLVLLRGKRSCFREKIPSFQITEKVMCWRGSFWKDHLFRKFEENIIFLCVF